MSTFTDANSRKESKEENTEGNNVERKCTDDIDDNAVSLLEKYAEELMNDTPTCEVSLKNLLALLLGQSLSPSLVNASSLQRNSSSSSSSLSEKDTVIPNELTYKLQNLPVFLDPDICLRVIRTIVRALNSEKLLLSLQDWTELNPQGDNQTADSRLAQIAQYKAALHLYEKVAREADGKTYKFFGKKFLILTGVWPEVTRRAMDMCPTDIPGEVLALFLEVMQESLVESSTSMTDDNNYTLVWASNFKEVLLKRQEKRREEVSDRLKEERERDKQRLLDKLRRERDGGDGDDDEEGGNEQEG